MELLVIFGPALVVGAIAAYKNYTSPRTPAGVGSEPDAVRTQLELEMVNRRDAIAHVR